jgi:3-hydroxyacyl-[acyl-carrier-protein] dehydratase
MRFLFYDRVTRLEKGKRILGVKSISSSEAFFEKHFTNVALVPGTLLIEAMAQLLGWLIAYSHDFQRVAIMSLIGGVRIPSRLKPGITLDIEGTLVTNTERDSLGTATVSLGGDPIARVERLIFRHFQAPAPEPLLKRFLYYGGIEDLAKLEGDR